MTWHGIEGHDGVVELFRTALARERLASSFLFAGPAGVGKATFARKLAQTLLCSRRPAEAMDPCEACPSCAQVRAGTHPDVIALAKPADRSEIPVELIIGPKEHRLREGLIHDLSLRPFMGGRKVAILDDADLLNEEGANALLKTLEEPPPRSVLILVGTSPARQLPTIRSRCQLVRFAPLPVAAVASILTTQELVSDPDLAARAAAASEGSVQRAVDLADPELWPLRQALFEHLGQLPADSLALAQTMTAGAEAAGSEAPPRRARLRILLGFALDYFRALLLNSSGAAPPADAELAQAVRAVARRPFHPEQIEEAIQRTLDALEHIDRMAHYVALVEAWADALAALFSRKG